MMVDSGTDQLIVGSIIYYTIHGTGVNSLDFNNDYDTDYNIFDVDTLTGMAKVGIYKNSDGSPTGPAAIAIGTRSDAITEGTEALRVQFFRTPPPSDFRGGFTYNNQSVTGPVYILSDKILDTSSGSQRIHRLRNTLTGQYLLTAS